MDLFTRHPQDFLNAQRAGANIVGGKVFPNDPKAPPELRTVSNQARAALVAALPHVGRIGDSVVALKA